MRIKIFLTVLRCITPLAKQLLEDLNAKENLSNKDKRRIYLLKKFLNLMEIEICSKTIYLKNES